MFRRGILSNRLAHFSRYLVSPSLIQPPRFRLVIPLKGDAIIFFFSKRKTKRERERKRNTRQKRGERERDFELSPRKCIVLFFGKTIGHFIYFLFFLERGIFKRGKNLKRITRYFHSLSPRCIDNRCRNERESHSLDLRQVSSTFACAKHALRKQGRRTRHAGFIPVLFARPTCFAARRGGADTVKRGRHGEESEAGESVDRREIRSPPLFRLA